MRTAVVALVLVLLLAQAEALYVILVPGEEKCFFTTLPEHTDVQLDFTLAVDTAGRNWNQSQSKINGDVHLSVRDVMDREIYNTQIEGGSGRFVFTTTGAGEYSACVEVAGKRSIIRSRRRLQFTADFNVQKEDETAERIESECLFSVCHVISLLQHL
ncbi:TMP21-related protein [Kipferlia bialata]|uniref:TMP21-related protein n=1 Tax=Kipferlia bialata TaxID=797122 RepID=A0A391NVN4_9EUKA|nr:TMP21-related protein [Kipferlia bialata]|eukprot:g4347.t1